MRVFSVFLLSFLFLHTSAQKKYAFVSGQVIDENENPVAKASVIILGKTTGVMTNDTGYFRIKVPAEKSFAIQFTHTGYGEAQTNFYLSENEQEKITVRLEKSNKTLSTIIVTDDKKRKELGLTKINPKS